MGEHLDPEHPLNLIRAYESSSIFRGGDTRSLAAYNEHTPKIPSTQGLHLQNRRSLFAYANRKSLIKNRNSSLNHSIIPTTGASKGKMNHTLKIADPATALSRSTFEAADSKARPASHRPSRITNPGQYQNIEPSTTAVGQERQAATAHPVSVSF